MSDSALGRVLGLGYIRGPMAEAPLSTVDPTISKLIADENRREHESLRLIASENYASRAVMDATGSCLGPCHQEFAPLHR